MNRIRWSALALVALILSLAIGQIGVAAQATPAATPAAFADPVTAIAAGATWIASQQAEDGGWLGFSGTSDAGSTIDAVLALAAAGNVGASVDLASASAFLEANGKAYAETGPGAAAKLTMAAVVLGEDPHNFAGMDPLASAADGYSADTGFYGSGIFDTAIVLLAFAAAGESGPEQIVETFTTHQIDDGSWSFDGTTDAGNGDTNTTALVVQSLIASGRYTSSLIPGAIAYLKSTQLEGGFPFQGGETAMADANSTGVVVQALIAAGEDVFSDDWMNVGTALGGFQNSDGSFSYMLDPRDVNLYASAQALPALAGQAYPILSQDVYQAHQSLPACTPEQLATPVSIVVMPCAA